MTSHLYGRLACLSGLPPLFDLARPTEVERGGGLATTLRRRVRHRSDAQHASEVPLSTPVRAERPRACRHLATLRDAPAL